MRILFLLLAAVFAQSAAAQTAADPRWPEARGPLSLVDRMMNSTTISRSGGLFELRRKTAELYTPAFSLGSYPEYSGKRLALDGDRLEFFSYALNSRLYKDAAVLLFTDGLFNDSDTLRYLKGVLAYDIHDFALAAKCFSEVPSSSPYHTKAQSFTELWNARPELPGYKDKSPWLAGAMSAIIPIYLLFFPSPQPVVVIPEGSNLWLMLCHALFCTVGMYLLQIQALKRLSAFTVNLTYNLEPCYTIILAFLIFGEGRELNYSFYIGISLILLSVLLQTRRAFVK